MQKDTYIAQAIREAEYKEKNDAACKKILASREVLAHILKGVVPEYADSFVEEIADRYIEPDEILVNVPVSPGLTSKKEFIEGRQQEDSIQGEATVFFDVKFRALLPEKKTDQKQADHVQVYLYMDVEAQNRYYPGYPLEKRGIYYLSRLISAQIPKISQDTDYRILQKCYSIWICMGDDIPKQEQNSITEYSFGKKDVYGISRSRQRNYDLMSMVILRLGKGSTEERTLGMLKTLFLGSMNPEERLEKLGKDYQMKVSEEMKMEVRNMYTFSQLIEDQATRRGMEKGMAKGIEKGIEKGITIYKTLQETGSVQTTAARLNESPDMIREIALEYQVNVSD